MRGHQDAAAYGLRVLDDALTERHWLVGGQPTIADLAVYGYTHVADEAGVSLAPYPHVQAWCQRVEALPGFVAMPRWDV